MIFFSEKEDKEEKREIEIGTQRQREREGRERSEEGWGKKIIEILVINNVTLFWNPKSSIQLLNPQRLGMNGFYWVYE